MKIEGVTVSIDFGDYLLETLPRNQPFFDRIVVVTTEHDLRTRKVCGDCGVSAILTNCYRYGGASFDLGAARNRGLDACKGDGWLCTLDADIVLPKGLRSKLPSLMASICEEENLHQAIFGLQRWTCKSRQQWRQYLKRGYVDNSIKLHIHKKNKSLPTGFFQLWYSPDQQLRYPEGYKTAGGSDLAFARQFSIKRHLAAFAVHLNTMPFEHGVNWRGRLSPQWGLEE